MKAFVINLDSSTDRWAHFQAKMLGVLDDVERISAVDGRTLTDKWRYLSPWMYLTHEPNKFNIMPAVGCFLSHRKCWQAVLDKKLPHALVLEDDVLPTSTAKACLEAFDSKPLPFDWLKLHVHRHSNRKDRQSNIGLKLAGNELCVDMAGSKSNAGYIITEAGARKALQMTRLLAPIDHLEWLHANHSLSFAQVRENVIEVNDSLKSSITARPERSLRRIPAVTRIGLVRRIVGRAYLRSNLAAAMQLAAGMGVNVSA